MCFLPDSMSTIDSVSAKVTSSHNMNIGDITQSLKQHVGQKQQDMAA